MKQSLRYDQLSCRLQVEGFPDVSSGQGGLGVGIITGWSLQWLGRPEVEGQREHLVALMDAVLPYARHLLSGVARGFGDGEAPVRIEPAPAGGHTLLLRSSQSGNPSLTVSIDDAELADLVRVLDSARLDPRLQLPLNLPQPRPLRARELAERLPLRRRLAAPVGGLAAVGLLALLSSLLPLPPVPRSASPAAAPAAPSSQPRR
ncbi:MAG: DUF4335 domain-containing protein [Synechococcus sp. ELA057]